MTSHVVKGPLAKRQPLNTKDSPMSEKERKPKLLTIRITEEHLRRLDVIVERSKKSNPLANRQDIVRDLSGFTKYGLTDESDREFLCGKMTEEEYRKI